ncbi:uncharacterized protein LOC119335439 [Triticum dicoccoides]|uniref:uncharacterized protein LOC119335439 n=1 Tax=Triticum dicoccoides TaxID=85692 RepID=UPI001891C3BE|nr:uncharacterized protein LOC119335439 [Triticum dicoccoides]
MGGQTFDAGEFFTIIPMAAQTEDDTSLYASAKRFQVLSSFLCWNYQVASSCNASIVEDLRLRFHFLGFFFRGKKNLILDVQIDYGEFVAMVKGIIENGRLTIILHGADDLS